MKSSVRSRLTWGLSALLAILIGLVFYGFANPPVPEATMLNGKRLTLEAVSAGGIDRTVRIGKPWQQIAGQLLSRAQAERFGCKFEHYDNKLLGVRGSVLDIWTLAHDTDYYRFGFEHPDAALVDRAGVEYPCVTRSWQQRESRNVLTRWTWDVYPRGEPILQFRLYERGRDGALRRSVEFPVSNPQVVSPTNATPASWPTQPRGDLKATVVECAARTLSPPPLLTGLSPVRVPRAHLSDLWLRLRLAGPDRDWRITEVEVRDEVGNVVDGEWPATDQYQVLPDGDLTARIPRGVWPGGRSRLISVRLARPGDVPCDVEVLDLPLPTTGSDYSGAKTYHTTAGQPFVVNAFTQLPTPPGLDGLRYELKAILPETRADYLWFTALRDRRGWVKLRGSAHTGMVNLLLFTAPGSRKISLRLRPVSFTYPVKQDRRLAFTLPLPPEPFSAPSAAPPGSRR